MASSLPICQTVSPIWLVVYPIGPVASYMAGSLYGWQSPYMAGSLSFLAISLSYLGGSLPLWPTVVPILLVVSPIWPAVFLNDRQEMELWQNVTASQLDSGKQVQKYSKAATNKKEAISNGEHKSKSLVRLLKCLKRYRIRQLL